MTNHRTNYLQIALFLLLSGGFALPGICQIFEFPPSQPLELHQPLDQEARMQQRNAIQLENRGEYAAALGFYQKLFQRYSEYDPFYEGVIRGFIATEKYALGLSFVDSLKSSYPNSIRIQDWTLTEQERYSKLIIDGGRFVGRQGQREEAFQRWEIAYTIPHASPNAFFRLMSSMIDCRFVDGLEEMAKKARKATGDPSLLAASLAGYWAERGQADRATEELLGLLEVQPRQAESIQRQILSMPEDEQTRAQVESSLKAATSRDAIRLPVWETLSQFYFRNRQWDKAYEAVRQADLLGGSSGQEMLTFAETLNSEQESELALRVLDDLRNSHPEIAQSPRARLARGRALEATRAYPSADSVYASLTDLSVLKSVYEQEALLRRARIKLENLRQPEAARALIQDRLQKNNRLLYRGQLTLLVGDSYLAEQNFIEARTTYLSVASGQFPGEPEVRSQALVSAARADVLLGDLTQALSRLEEASRANPEGLLTNDALTLLELLRAGEADSNAVRHLFQAELNAKLGGDEPALALYDQVVQKTRIAVLAEEALWRQAELTRKQQPQKAIQALETALTRFPKSLRAAEFLFQIGQIYERELGDLPQAIKAYERILIEYPNSLPVQDARRRIRELETAKS